MLTASVAKRTVAVSCEDRDRQQSGLAVVKVRHRILTYIHPKCYRKHSREPTNQASVANHVPITSSSIIRFKDDYHKVATNHQAYSDFLGTLWLRQSPQLEAIRDHTSIVLLLPCQESHGSDVTNK